MAVPLLQTKLYVPPPGPKLVSRPRLIEQLNAGLGRKLTLVSAPAGFGKTTLLSEWIHRRGTDALPAAIPPADEAIPSTDPTGAPLCAAWLSLDEGDNDLARFLSYTIAALQTIDPRIGQDVWGALQSGEPFSVEAVLTSLLNEIAGLPWGPYVLVLDDYHAIETPAIDRALAFLLDHLPRPPLGGIHLVLASRTDPTLPLSRLRARGQLTELRTADLRFTGDEVAVFLQSLQLPLTPQDVRTLERRTEGWVTGLQLAALALQGAAAQGLEPGEPIARFIQSFGGSHRYVIDYLVDEVLERQTPTVRAFLVQTSILARLSAPLCNAVLGREDSQPILEELESANLFLIPLDGERRWYRYHHLFAELLAHRLARVARDRIPELHGRASLWYESEGFTDEAFRHARAAGDVERAMGIVESHWPETIHRGQLIRLKRWLDALGAVYTQSASLCMAHCWFYHLTGANDALPRCIRETREALDRELRDRRQHPQLAILPSLLETIESVVAQSRGEPAAAKDHAQKAIALIPDDPDPATRGLLHGAAGYRLASAQRALGEYEQAVEVLLEVLDMLKASQNCLGVANAVWLLATLYRESGTPQHAIAVCQDTLDYIRAHRWERMPSSGMVNLVLADLQADSGCLEEARSNLQAGRKLVEPLSSPEVFRLLDRVQQKLATVPSPGQPLVEPLSSRELEILQFIAQGLSNREIGERLFLALSTVKGHNRNLFGKLQVQSRTQAVARARELGLL